MNSKDRMNAVLNFQKPDSLPVIEWTPYWDQTVQRWQKEGMKANTENVDDYTSIRKHLFTKYTIDAKELKFAAKMQEENGAALFCWI